MMFRFGFILCVAYSKVWIYSYSAYCGMNMNMHMRHIITNKMYNSITPVDMLLGRDNIKNTTFFNEGMHDRRLCVKCYSEYADMYMNMHMRHKITNRMYNSNSPMSMLIGMKE